MNFNDVNARAALSFVQNQAAYIERQVNMAPRPDIQYPGLVPVDTSANPFAKTVTYYSGDRAGQAQWINGNADDVPMTSSTIAKHETEIHMAGIGYGYGWEEIEYARMLGINLASDEADAARRAYEEMLDRVFLEGDATKGFTGLFNNPDVPQSASSVGDWESADESAVLKDFNGGVLNVFNGTNTTAMADTVLLPWSRYNYLATTRLGDTQSTLLAFLQQNNAYTANTGNPLTIRGMRKLDTAGASGGTRSIFYRRSPEVLKAHLPMPHRFLPVYQAGPMRFEVPGVFRVGGLDVRRPREVTYLDGA